MLLRRVLPLIIVGIAACTSPPPPPAASAPASAPAPPPAAPRVLLPVDEASRDPSFLAFRESLIDIVKRKDSAALLAAIDPSGITSSFGGDGTLAEFKDMWKLEQPDSELWPTLQTVLSMGGAFRGDNDERFFAPYVFISFPDDLDDGWFAITAEDVPLRAAPRDDGPLVGRLSYTLVHVPESGPPDAWTHVAVEGMGSGYVNSTYLRSPTDWRAGFERRNGRWVMFAFVAGD